MIAEQVAAYRAGVEGRLRQAETERAAALVREAESHNAAVACSQSAAAVAFAVLIGIIFGTLLRHVVGIGGGGPKKCDAGVDPRVQPSRKRRNAPTAKRKPVVAGEVSNRKGDGLVLL